MSAQAPLVTDDAAVAALRTLHLELFGQFVRLPSNARPATSQATTVLTAGFGATPRLEIGFDYPFIVVGQPGGDVRGTGDLNLTAKYLVHTPADTLAARWALAGAVEIPTGSAARGLGSGVADFGLTVIRETWYHGSVVRFNVGLQVAGNTLTGRVGTANRAPVLNAAASVSRQVADGVTVVAEASGYQGRSPVAADREARLQGALILSRWARAALAVSLQRGWLASPPSQLQVGIIADAW